MTRATEDILVPPPDELGHPLHIEALSDDEIRDWIVQRVVKMVSPDIPHGSSDEQELFRLGQELARREGVAHHFERNKAYDGRASSTTRVEVRYMGAHGWYCRVRDGGPWDGARREFAAADTGEVDMLAWLRHFLCEREGAVSIERCATMEMDERAAVCQERAYPQADALADDLPW